MKRLRIPRSLYSRLLLTFFALSLAGTGFFVAWTSQPLQDDVLELAERDLEIKAQVVNDVFRDPFQHRTENQTIADRSLQDLVQSYAQSTSARIVVVDENLQIVAASDTDITSGQIEQNYPEFAAARRGLVRHDIRIDTWTGAERLFAAAAILDSKNAPIGFVQLSYPMAPVYESVRQTWLTLVGVAGIVIAVMMLASLLFARQIARPVQSLTVVTEQIAQGHLERRVVPGGPDEIQRLGRAFNQMAERVSDMLIRQREFVANAAHELRSPLAGIRLRLEILSSQAHGDSELTQRYLKQMDHELDYLQKLVEQLLTLSALDEHEPPLRQPLDLAPLLYQTADEMSPLAQHSELQFQIEVPIHLPLSNLSSEQMHVIIRNLLDNAIKYTPSGGRVTLRAERRDGRIYISVTDTGRGIPAEAVPHIFDRFYRVDKSRAGRERGSGLGLALVRAMVQANDGQMQVKSEPGVGSTFELWFPLCESTKEIAHPQNA